MGLADNTTFTSPFDKPQWHRPKTGRIHVNVMYHFGAKVQKVFVV